MLVHKHLDGSEARFDFREDTHGGFELVAVREDGTKYKDGHVLTLLPEAGSIVVHVGYGSDGGENAKWLARDEENRVIVEKE